MGRILLIVRVRMRALEDCQLYAFVDTAYLSGRAPANVARALCDGGSDIVQLRAKAQTKDETRTLAQELAPIFSAAGVWFVVNDYPEIALEVGAPICHLGQEDFFDAGFKRKEEVHGVREGLKLGLSTHAPPQAERAIEAGADYVAIGPIYATGTKPTAKPVTLDYVKWARSNVRVPWFAIGGIDLQTVDAVVEAGASRICVVSAILNAPDISKACHQFKMRLPSRTL